MLSIVFDKRNIGESSPLYFWDKKQGLTNERKSSLDFDKEKWRESPLVFLVPKKQELNNERKVEDMLESENSNK